MKTLAKVLGTYNTFHPKAKWRCMWCAVQAHQLGNLTILEWPLHTDEVIEKAEENVEKATKKGKSTEYCARRYFGIQGKRLLRFPRSSIIPCNLHCFMGVMRKLVNLLAADIEDFPQVVSDFEKSLLSCCKVKVFSSSKTKHMGSLTIHSWSRRSSKIMGSQ